MTGRHVLDEDWRHDTVLLHETVVPWGRSNLHALRLSDGGVPTVGPGRQGGTFARGAGRAQREAPAVGRHGDGAAAVGPQHAGALCPVARFDLRGRKAIAV